MERQLDGNVGVPYFFTRVRRWNANLTGMLAFHLFHEGEEMERQRDQGNPGILIDFGSGSEILENAQI